MGTTTTRDYEGDVGIDATFTATRTRDSKDRLVHAEKLMEATGEPTLLETSDFAYDAAGRPVAEDGATYREGVLVSNSSTTSTFDSEGRLISNLTALDADGDESNDRITTNTSTFDAKGRLVETLSEVRHGSGSLRSSVLQTISYTKTTMTTTVMSDTNGDGIIDQTVVNTKPA